MAVAFKRPRAKLFLGVMYHDIALLDRALEYFQKEFSVSPFEHSCTLEFSSFSTYYDAEMGGVVYKKYLLFNEDIDRDQLATIKSATNALEQQFLSDTGGRLINLDPGYLTRDKLVLASAKDFYHRLSIGDNIFAEVTLHFTEKGPRFFSWTYEDYLNKEVQSLLMSGRKLLLK